MDTPQAKVKSMPALADFVMASVACDESLNVDPPRLVTADGEVFDNSPAALRFIQNCGTNGVKYLVSIDEDCAEDLFHGILPGGVDQDDGKGGQLNCSRFKGRITILGVGGSPRVATFRGRMPHETGGLV